jgi:beta-N-acetylhexosaminidase
MIKYRKSFIVGLKSISISKNEISFLKKYKPWGVILFSRNIKSIEQTQKLIEKIKSIFNDINYPILIDQEGGRVSRVEKIINTKTFSANYFALIYKKNKKNISQHLNIYIDQICYLLREIGVNINTIPVLDIRRNNTNKVIGDRSFSKNPIIVNKLGSLFIEKFHKNKIASVIKHIPGHGLSITDSHLATPVVKKKLKYLLKNDFSTFRKKKSLFAMTAHIIYESIDPINTATHSKKIINIIRNKIRFKNVIISDDVSMKGLKFSIEKNTIKAFNAGCNIVLHCNGRLTEMIKVAKNSPKLDSFLMKKTSEFYKLIS